MNKVMTKKDRYYKVIQAIDAFIGPEGYDMTDIGRMATISSILASEFKEWIFTGFYRTIKPGLLEIGPYQGDVLACGTIKFGKGVCGTAAEKLETVIVDNVNEFPGYIACDGETVSEIVVPVIRNGQCIAVLDIDTGTESAFDEVDKQHLEKIVTYC